MAARGRRNYTAAEALKLVFADEDSDNANFDCGSDQECVPDSEDSGDSDLETSFANLQMATDTNLPENRENTEAISGDFSFMFITKIINKNSFLMNKMF